MIEQISLEPATILCHVYNNPFVYFISNFTLSNFTQCKIFVVFNKTLTIDFYYYGRTNI